MFDDPTTMGLLGLAQGFGQAAMPSRMPVSFGAAMGMGGAGMMQGAQAGLAGQQQEQALAAARMTNQYTAAMMPGKIATMQDVYGLPATGGGQPGQYMPGSLAGPQHPGLLRQAANWVGNQFDPSSPQQDAPSQQQGGGSPGGTVQPQPPTDPNAPPMDPATAALIQMGKIGRAAYAQGDFRGYGQAQERIQGFIKAGVIPGVNDGLLHAIPGATKAAYAESQATAAGAGAGAQPFTQGNDAFKAQLDQITHGVNSATDTSALASRAETDALIARWKAKNVGGFQKPGDVWTSGADTAAGGAMPLADYTQRVNGVENTTGDPTARSATSSAMGNGQFTADTFVPLFRKTYPQMASLSDAQVLQMRGMPGVSDAMTGALAQQNAPGLVSAGFKPTADNLYLAHHFGTGGATSMLRADPATPLSDEMLGKGVMAANPDLAGLTAGGYRANNTMRWGTAPVQLGPAPTSGRVPLDPIGTSRQAEATKQGEEFAALPKQLNDSAQKAAYSNNIMDRTDAAMQTGAIKSGRLGPVTTSVLAMAKGSGIDLSKWGVNPNDLGNAQVGQEGLMQIGWQLMHQLNNGGEDDKNVRLSNADIIAMLPKVASWEQDPTTIQNMFKTMRAQNQYSIDKAQSANNWLRDPQNGQSMRGWEPTWISKNPYSPVFQSLYQQPGAATPDSKPTGPGNVTPPGDATPSAAAGKPNAAPVVSKYPAVPAAAASELASNPMLWREFERKYGQGSATEILARAGSPTTAAMGTQ